MSKTGRFLFLVYEVLIAGPIFIVATFITATVTIIGCTFGNRDFWGYHAPSIWSRFVCRLFFVKVTVRGRENIDSATSYVFVANHQGAFDIWAVYGYLHHNFKWLMKKELKNIFMVGMACQTTGHIFVDDSSVAGIKETISESEKTLTDGMSLVVFPEGSRSWDGKMIPFKRGAFMLASEFNLPVVPITIDGSFRTMPRYTYRITPGNIILTIHKPIYPGPGGFRTRQLMVQCRECIQSALPEKDRDEASS